MRNGNLSDDFYVSICLKLMDFKFPKRKAIEHLVNLEGQTEEDLINEAKLLVEQFELENARDKND
jgi:hypothetical protein